MMAWVASFTDAWIETLNIDNFVKAATSHPLQMRGLKHTRDVGNQTQCVASFTDAWIETYKEIIEGRFDGRIFYRCVD